LTSAQKETFMQHLVAYRPAVLTVVNEVGWAVEAKDVSPETLVIWRRFHDLDNNPQSWTAQSYANYITLDGQLDKRLWVYIWNEPNMDVSLLPATIQKTLDVVDHVEAMGYHAVVGNIGTANIEPATIDSGVFDGLLFRAATWKHLMGYHTYTGLLVPFGVGYWTPDDLRNPVNVQPENWPEITPDTLQSLMYREQLGAEAVVPPDSSHYWHILREEWLQARAVQIGAGRHKYVITEGLLDRMPDLTGQPDNIYAYLEQTYGVPPNTEGIIKGAPTLEYVWAAWWPYWSFDEALWQQCHWMERNASEDCIGWCWFAWVFDRYTNKRQKWEEGFNIGGRWQFQQLLVANRDVPATPPDPMPNPEPPPLPEPTPDAPPWLLPVMVVVCGILVALVIYGIFRPRPVAQGAYLMEDILNQLFAIPVFATVTYTSAIVYFLVEVWKRSRQRWFNNVKWLKWAEPEVVATLLVILFVGLHGIAAEYAYENVLKQVAQFATDLIGALGPYVLGMIGTNAVLSYSYDKLQAADVPGFTYKIRKREIKQ
jgi:hypothetical protein